MTNMDGKSAAMPRPSIFVVTFAAQLRLISETHLSREGNARLSGSAGAAPKTPTGGESAAAQTPTAVAGLRPALG